MTGAPSQKEMNNRTVVYILSSAHSGSTLIDMMIGAHPSCTSLGEFKHIVERVADRSHNICAICRDRCVYWDRFAQVVEPPYYHSTAFEVFGTPILVDSSKSMNWIRSNLPYVGAEVKIVSIIRQGLATLTKAKRKHGSITKNHVMTWLDANLRLDSFIRDVSPRNRLTVRYEDLCDNTDAVLARVCNFLQISYKRSMEQFWTAHHHVIGGNTKPIALAQLHSGTRTVSELHPDVQDFISRNGFSIQLDNRYSNRLSERDRLVFEKYGGWLDARRGYRRSSIGSRFRFGYYSYLVKKQLRARASLIIKKFGSSNGLP